MNWNDWFFGIAYAVRKKSKDKHTKIGAVIVGKGHEIISAGYNSLPRGINDDVSERYERPEKYNWMCHAERNAIYNAARIGVATVGCEMYVTAGMPCINCARAIVQSGIWRIHIIPGAGAKGGYYDKEFDISRTILDEGGVEVIEHEEPTISIG